MEASDQLLYVHPLLLQDQRASLKAGDGEGVQSDQEEDGDVQLHRVLLDPIQKVRQNIQIFGNVVKMLCWDLLAEDLRKIENERLSENSIVNAQSSIDPNAALKSRKPTKVKPLPKLPSKRKMNVDSTGSEISSMALIQPIQRSSVEKNNIIGIEGFDKEADLNGPLFDEELVIDADSYFFRELSLSEEDCKGPKNPYHLSARDHVNYWIVTNSEDKSTFKEAQPDQLHLEGYRKRNDELDQEIESEFEELLSEKFNPVSPANQSKCSTM